MRAAMTFCLALTLLFPMAAFAQTEAQAGKKPKALQEMLEQREAKKQMGTLKELKPEELAVRDVLTAQQAAWNRGDIDGFMKGYWQSEELRFASGGTVTLGWQATLDRYNERYGKGGKMGRLTFSGLHSVVHSPESVVLFGRWKLERAKDKGGEASGLFTLVFRKIEGQWVIVHDHTSAG